SLPQAAFLAPDARMFRQFLEQQEVFLFFITVYAGAGLIAADRRANALQIYLSKPLTRLEYIAGKLTILITILLLVTWMPAAFLNHIADAIFRLQLRFQMSLAVACFVVVGLIVLSGLVLEKRVRGIEVVT